MHFNQYTEAGATKALCELIACYTFKTRSFEITQTDTQILIASGTVMCLCSDAAPTSQ